MSELRAKLLAGHVRGELRFVIPRAKKQLLPQHLQCHFAEPLLTDSTWESFKTFDFRLCFSN